MDLESIDTVFDILEQEIPAWSLPSVSSIALDRDPFTILIATVLSLRTKDATTLGAAKRLFSLASDPSGIAELPIITIEKAIYPVGFYHTKAGNISRISRIIQEKYKGKVASDIETLLELPGVGRKTANLVITLGFNKEGICVDTHVHRITNRWGYLSTKNPYDTEMELREKLPKKYWTKINDFLVVYGQNICRPVRPLCPQCRLYAYCDRVGVKEK
ncbi:MAG: endonuclease III [Thermodesulfobacteriota bacterium]|nr:endonuclease III [Thermodesulfobacteriota bacterium]